MTEGCGERHGKMRSESRKRTRSDDVGDASGGHGGREPRPAEACYSVSYADAPLIMMLFESRRQVVLDVAILSARMTIVLPDIVALQFTQTVHQMVRGQGRCDRMLGGGLVAEPSRLSCHVESRMSESSRKRGSSLDTMYRTMASSGRARRKYKRRLIRLSRKTTNVTASHESSDKVIRDGRFRDTLYDVLGIWVNNALQERVPLGR